MRSLDSGAEIDVERISFRIGFQNILGLEISAELGNGHTQGSGPSGGEKNGEEKAEN